MKNILVALSLFVGMFVHADEGMWFLMFLDRLNQRDMEKWAYSSHQKKSIALTIPA